MIICDLYHTHLSASRGSGMVLVRVRIYSGYEGMKESAEAGEGTLFQKIKETSYFFCDDFRSKEQATDHLIY